jgi:hypothetical protein
LARRVAEEYDLVAQTQRNRDVLTVRLNRQTYVEHEAISPDDRVQVTEVLDQEPPPGARCRAMWQMVQGAKPGNRYLRKATNRAVRPARPGFLPLRATDSPSELDGGTGCGFQAHDGESAGAKDPKVSAGRDKIARHAVFSASFTGFGTLALKQLIKAAIRAVTWLWSRHEVDEQPGATRV